MEIAMEIPQATEIPDVEAQDPYVLSPAEESELLAGHPWSRFAVLGDSIAMGMGDPTEGYVTATWGGRVAAAEEAVSLPEAMSAHVSSSVVHVTAGVSAWPSLRSIAPSSTVKWKAESPTRNW